MKSILKSNQFRESFILYPPIGIPIALENPTVRKTVQFFWTKHFSNLLGQRIVLMEYLLTDRGIWGMGFREYWLTMVKSRLFSLAISLS